jgi:hypothetical protein
MTTFVGHDHGTWGRDARHDDVLAGVSGGKTHQR